MNPILAKTRFLRSDDDFVLTRIWIASSIRLKRGVTLSVLRFWNHSICLTGKVSRKSVKTNFYGHLNGVQSRVYQGILEVSEFDTISAQAL